MRHHARVAFLIGALIAWAFIAPSAGAQLIQTVAGNGSAGYSGDGVSATSTDLNNPFGMALDKNGNIYIADTGNNRVRVVNVGTSPLTLGGVIIQPGTIGTVAGNGNSGFSGDGGPATSAQLTPYGVAVDNNGTIYISDTGNYRVRAVNTGTSSITVANVTIQPGKIETVAGNGSNTASGDNGPATGAGVYPWALAVRNGNIYIADTANNRIRVVNGGTSPVTVGNVTIQPGNIATVAGNGNYGIGGDGGPALNVEFELPYGVAVESNGNIYICDTYNRYIHAVNAGTAPVTIAGVTIQPGNIVAVAGIGAYGFRGDGLPSTTAEFADPDAVQVDSAGNFYVSDTENERIRMVNAVTGLTSTIAGLAEYGYNGDGIPATSAWLSYPRAIAVDAAGNVYFVDEPNERIRKIAENPGAPVITSRNGTAFTVGIPGSFTVTTADLPTSFLTETGNLPNGITFVDNNNGTGTLSGTPTSAAGSPFTISFKATNGVPPNAVQNFTLTIYPPGGGPSAAFVAEDTTTEGSWQGHYGADGYDLANAAPSLPNYATFSVSNQVNYTWASTTTDPRALQIPGTSTGFAEVWYSNSTLAFDVNFTDGNPHQFALYALDWDQQGRSETVQILDVNSGLLLDSETISNFGSGVYLVWNLSGHVQINVLPNNSGNGVVSGVFFGGAGTLATSILEIKKTHTGTFTQGENANYTVTVSNLPNAAPTNGLVTVTETVPSGLTLVSTAGSGWNCEGASCSRSDALGGGTSYPSITVTVTVAANATTPQINQVIVTGGGSQSASASDTTTIVSQAGAAVVTAPANDYKTQGAWQSIYGTDGYSIAAVNPQHIPAYATFSVQNESTWTWESNTSDPRALQNPSGSGGIASTWYDPSHFYFDVNMGAASHPFAIYAVDWDSKGRLETVQILDASTSALLYTQSVANFVNGVYLTWNISGHVKIAITSNGGPNCVVSGVFFGGGPNPETIAATAGTIQSATLGTSFATLLQATVQNGGSPVNGATVIFTAPSSGASGTFAGGGTTATVTTDSSGVANAPAFSANGTVGGPYSVTATAAGASGTATFSLTNTAAPVTTITATAGAAQSAIVGTSYGTLLQAAVQLGGSPVNGASVTFTAPSSGASGTFAGGGTTATVPTNSSGIANAPIFTANGTLGGPYIVTATGSGASGTANFSLTNTAAPVETITATAGTAQSAVVGTSFTTALQATVQLGGSPVKGASVTFTAPSSGASGTFAGGGTTVTVATDSSGVANAPIFTANGTVGGPYTVTASDSSVSGTTNFSLTNTSPPVETIAATAGAAQSTAVGSPLGALLQATVQLGGSPQSGVTVTFTAPSTGASGTFASGGTVATATTNSAGVATAPVFTANSTVGGPYTVTASTTAAPGTANFSLTNTPPGGTCAGPPCASFVAFDSVTEGNWSGVYGSDGYSLANVSQHLPGYASFSVQSQLNYTWDPGPSDARALQVPGGSARIAATWYSGSPFTLDLNFTDGNTHAVALYAVDWDNKSRAETFQVTDPSTNAILDIRSISSFANGIYLVWNVSGHVVISVINTASPNGVVSGVFFGRSGSVNVSVNPQSINLAAGQAQQFAATVIGSTNQNVTWAISPAVGSISTIGLYSAPATVSTQQTIGVTATSAVTGSTLGTAIVNLRPGAAANFVTYNTSSEGNWPGTYGVDGYSIVNVANQLIPSYVSNFTVQNAASYSWIGTTSDPRALLVPGSSNGTAGTLYSASAFNINVNFADGNIHPLELYALDWDNKGRAETIQVLDANTNAILDTRNISQFTNGTYLVWNISGSVKITITVTAGANAVISGAFFK